MNYGMYISASGILTGIARQDVLANNLANMETPSFKEDFAPVMQREAARIEDGLGGSLPSNKMLERLGAGAHMAPIQTSYLPAALKPSNSPFDLGIEGQGFLVVDTGKGTGDQRFRLTRDGRTTTDPSGRLISATSGLPLLDTNNRAITLDPKYPMEVAGDGVVRQNGAEIATLKFVSPPDTKVLIKAPGGLYSFAGERLPTGGARGAIRQFNIEASGVDPFKALMRITNAGTAVEANSRMLALHDQALGRAVGTLGRVS